MVLTPIHVSPSNILSLWKKLSNNYLPSIVIERQFGQEQMTVGRKKLLWPACGTQRTFSPRMTKSVCPESLQVRWSVLEVLTSCRWSIMLVLVWAGNWTQGRTGVGGVMLFKVLLLSSLWPLSTSLVLSDRSLWWGKGAYAVMCTLVCYPLTGVSLR